MLILHNRPTPFNINGFVFPGCPSYVACTTLTGHVQGNAARNSLEEPGINNWDLSLVKHTKISERLNTEFRAEFYNAGNHTQFGAPSNNLTAGSFGVIGGVLVPPRVIQLALKLLW